MARKPDWSAVKEYLDYKEEYPSLNNSEIARLMGKDPRQIRRIVNDYLKRDRTELSTVPH